MSRSDYSFDWKGFIFFLKVGAACLAFAAIGNYGLSYLSPPAPLTHIASSTSPARPIQAAPYVPPPATTTPLRVVQRQPQPLISARAYLVADIDTGEIYKELNPDVPRPIASITKLMTALVAQERIGSSTKLSIQEGELGNLQNIASTTQQTFSVGDLFYPLLMQSSNAVAKSLAVSYGEKAFVEYMNVMAKALGMTSTTFADASGISPRNISTPQDLLALAAHLAGTQPWVFDMTHKKSATITADDGSTYFIKNINTPADKAPFFGRQSREHQSST